MSPKALLRPLILASTSRYRAALLERFGLPFEARNPGVEETEEPDPGAAVDARDTCGYHPEAP